MAASKKGWIKHWKDCDARELIIKDLEEGVVPLYENRCTVEEAWEHRYLNGTLPGFEEIVFSQFEANFEKLRKLIQKKFAAASTDEKDMAAFLQRNPKPTHNHRGEPNWDAHAAKQFLCDDLINGEDADLTAHEFRRTRPEYKEFTLEIFRRHIYQEQRRQRFINWLEHKRNKTEEKRKKRVAKARREVAKAHRENPDIELQQDVMILVEVNEQAQDPDDAMIVEVPDDEVSDDEAYE
jgi:hypothetical protein